MKCKILAAICMIGAPIPVFAQSNSVPVLSADMPDLAVPEKDWADDRKYLIFHKEGVSLEQATADLTFCWQFVPYGVSQKAPTFVPWPQTAATRKQTYSNNQLGFGGALILGIIAGPIERGIRQSRLYRCMVPRGYARYRTSKDVWNILNSNGAEQSIRLQAQIAAGPVPPTARILP